MTSELRRAALHEAAHAIAAREMGHEVISVDVDIFFGGGRVRTRGPERTFNELEDSLVITQAGPIAEHIMCGTPLDSDTFAGDRRCEAELIGKMAKITNFLDADLMALECERRATSLVLSKRKAIEILADQLMQREFA